MGRNSLQDLPGEIGETVEVNVTHTYLEADQPGGLESIDQPETADEQLLTDVVRCLDLESNEKSRGLIKLLAESDDDDLLKFLGLISTNLEGLSPQERNNLVFLWLDFSSPEMLEDTFLGLLIESEWRRDSPPT